MKRYNANMFQNLNKKYYDAPLSSGFVSLYIGKTIVMLASAFLGIFLPIFLYELFNQSLSLVAIYYGVGYLSYGLVVSLGGKFISKFGFRKALQVSVFFGALIYVSFYFMDQSNLLFLIPISLLALTLHRLFYWLPFHVDFAKFTNKKNRARQVSVFRATRLILSIFAPLAAGFLIIKFGFDVLFIIAIVLFIISGIPYLTIPHTKEKFSWSLKRTYQELFSKNKRKIIIAYVADGSENVVGLVIWPIFIYQLLNGDYFQVGAISTFIIAMTVVLQLALGKHIDLKKSQGKILKWGSVFYSLGWLIKIFIVTAFQIFLAGAYHSIARIFLRTPFELLTYEIAADQGHYVDEFTVLHEMAMNFGKVMTILLVIMMSPYFSIQWIFLVAAVATLVFNLLNVERREKKLIYS